MQFQQDIISWYLVNKRDLPWRNTKDPYLIWLSEIILQQTRVAQGLPYFERFCQHFPTVFDLASADEQAVLNLWQGLGYYSRGRNLHQSAKYIVQNLNGEFPTSYAELLKLKGIGAYTAAAIASFSAGHVHAVVDGNVYRVLSRYFGVEEAIDTTIGKKVFAELADSLIQDVDPGIYNQAIMEFGAIQCKPARPDCDSCPLNIGCWARKHNKVEELPSKIKSIKKKIRYFSYLVFQDHRKILIKERKAGDIWQGLNDFPLIESGSKGNVLHDLSQIGLPIEDIELIHSERHILTHQILEIQFFSVKNLNTTFIQNAEWRWVDIEQLDQVPVPIVIHKFLSKNILSSDDRS